MDNQKIKNWLTEGIIIALVPFLGYLFAFAYESGHAKFYNFPREFINIGLAQIIGTIIGIYTVGVIIFLHIEQLSIKIPKNKRALYHSIVRLLPLVGFFIGNLIVYGLLVALPFIIIFLYLGFFEFIYPMLTQCDKKTYNDKLQASSEDEWKSREEHDALSVRLSKIFGHRNIVFVINLMLCVLLTELAGQVAASREMQFFVVPNNPQKIVLRIYGDNLICTPFDRETKTIKKDISVYKLTDSEVQNIKLEKIGPIKIEK